MLPMHCASYLVACESMKHFIRSTSPHHSPAINALVAYASQTTITPSGIDGPVESRELLVLLGPPSTKTYAIFRTSRSYYRWSLMAKK
jgi:hypothetical protein